MKKLLLCLLLCTGILPLFAQFRGGGGEKLPKIQGNSGPLVVLFNGARPWQGNDMAAVIQKSGCRVLPLTSVYLDGHGGATIKQHMTDKEEPAAFDGITPAFANAAQYAAFLFHQIPPKEMEAIFTPERVEMLRAYVEQGGHVFFDINAPASLGALLPVKLEGYQDITGDYTADIPRTPAFSAIPCQTAPVWRVFRKASLLPGAELLSTIRNPQGEEQGVFLARRQLGKGTVTFLNAIVINPRQIHEFSNWAYRSAFLTGILRDTLKDASITPSNCITRLEAYPQKTPVTESLDIAVLPPLLDISPCEQPATVTSATDPESEKTIYTAIFPNGIVLTTDAKGNVAVAWDNDHAHPVIRQLSIPVLRVSKSQAVFDSSTAEAVDVKENLSTHKIQWRLRGAEAKGNQVVFHYAAPRNKAKMDWVFRSGKMQLDGREFQGFAEHAELLEFPLLVSGFGTTAKLTLPDPLFARRNSCYSPPRGYTDFDMSGKTKGDTFTWGFFGSGQPFELVACRNHVYLGNEDEVQPGNVQLIRDKGEDCISSTHNVSVGRRKAPIRSTDYWRWFGQGAERPNHQEYLAMYQFMRQYLRRKAGLKELPPYPEAGYSYQLTEEEQEAVIEAAKKAGYRHIYHPNPESPIEKLTEPRLLKVYNFLRDRNMGCQVWSAGGYVQGNGGWIINAHPEWFLRNEKNEIHKYFGTYPVIDLHTPEFYDWYTALLKTAIDNGLNWIYRDMDGAASGGINYAKEESHTGLEALVKFYRFFHDNNVRVGVEGMNALVIDEYWYRPNLYTSFAGKEFALIGQHPKDGGGRGGITLDPFRTGMYCCFMSGLEEDAAFGVERYPGELERIRRAHSFIPAFNEALDLCGMPYVRETPFGTSWIGENGGALFFWNPAKEVKVRLPDGWKIRGIEGNVLKDVPGDSIFFLEKK